jgi:hypothetical protein
MAMKKLTQDFKEFFALLNSEKIDYLLIGGYAVALYGYVRGTKDIDIWIATEPENLDRVRAALVKFGFSAATLAGPLFTDKQDMIRIGVPPNRLELVTKIAGVEFRDCYSRRKTIDYEGMPISVIDLEDLKRNKMASGRPKDVEDVQMLEKAKSKDAGSAG